MAYNLDRNFAFEKISPLVCMSREKSPKVEIEWGAL